jgi:poly-gamma-glutamate synthesis protein (capsule biosynthesis protein)
VFAAGRAGRLLVFGVGVASSGIPAGWAAGADRPGINYLPDCSAGNVDGLVEAINARRRDGDIVLASVHWGGNWGYDVPDEHVALAHRLVDEAGVDIVHGHSSHHPMAVEVYHGRAVMYGCGDLLNDYEGIRGYEAFRSDLTAMYFPVLDPDGGELIELLLTPMQIRRLRLEHCEAADVEWMAARLREQGRRFGVGVQVRAGRLSLEW